MPSRPPFFASARGRLLIFNLLVVAVTLMVSGVAVLGFRHASQIQESFWAHLPTEAFEALFGEETFIRAHDTTGAPLPETDLFVGLR